VYRDEYEDAHVSERFISDAPEASRRLEEIKRESVKIESLLEIGSGIQKNKCTGRTFVYFSRMVITQLIMHK
jgi:hypothetical protein